MGTLADWQIHERCKVGMVTPYDPALLNPASLDLRLGSNIMIESAESPEMVLVSIAKYTEENPYLIVPGQFFLAETEELFNIPNDLEGQFILKSSRARSGLEHLFAGFGDPGWHGSRLTLELLNVRQLWPIGIYPGLKIGQMKFSRMDAEPKRSYAITGRYNNNTSVTPSKG